MNGPSEDQRKRRRHYRAGGQSGVRAAHPAVERGIKRPARVAALQANQSSHDAAPYRDERDEADRSSEGGQAQAARHLDGSRDLAGVRARPP